MAIGVERFPKGQPVLAREVLCPNPTVAVQRKTKYLAKKKN